MDKFEIRRLGLKRLVDGLGRGGIAHVARQIGKEPNYVSRLLYPATKPGAKRIGEDTSDLLSAAFPGWNEGNAVKDVQAPYRAGSQWPFESITPGEWWAIPSSRRADIEASIRAIYGLHVKQESAAA